MKRKKSLRQYCQEKRQREGKPSIPMHKRGQQPDRPRAGLKKQSKARAREQRLYLEESREWLARPENAACAICLVQGITAAPATEVHHYAGRIGRLLRYQPYWIPSCRPCRPVPHDRPNWAREMGILASPAEWNVYPKAA